MIVAALFAVVLTALVTVGVHLLPWQDKIAGKDLDSLAVLPLENLSGDPEQEYFADGMTGALITDLGKIGALRVISRPSVMPYKGVRKPLPETARELNVEAVVVGSVLRTGDRVRITAQLIEAATERQLWSESYERDLRDVLELQREIARAIADEVRVKLTPQEQAQLAKSRPVNAEAYDYYLRGVLLNRRHKPDNQAAIINLERALTVDQTFAPAYAALAHAYAYRFFFFAPEEEKQLAEKAAVAVDKALSLDPDLAEAYIARGRLLWTPSNHFPHERVIQEFRRAMALNPNSDQVHSQLAIIYNHVGLLDEALQEARTAVAINPSSAEPQSQIGMSLLYQGQYEQALPVWLSIPQEVLVDCLIGFST